jgi:hypothetical protein
MLTECDDGASYGWSVRLPEACTGFTDFFFEDPLRILQFAGVSAAAVRRYSPSGGESRDFFREEQQPLWVPKMPSTPLTCSVPHWHSGGARLVRGAGAAT